MIGNYDMRVCVITIIDYKNYGNRLQNFALNKVLEKFEIEVVNGLEYFSKSEWILEKENKGQNTFFKKKVPLSVLKCWFNLRRKLSCSNKQYEGRIKKLRKFTRSNMYTFPCLYVEDNEDLKKRINDENIDYYFVGSDQVWNPYYEGHDFEFLTFVESRKRGSFSASFGVDTLPEVCKSRYASYLKDFQNLSVREKSGQNIVKELLNKEAHISVDPTLLLQRSEWEDVLKKNNTNEFTGEYIVTYFLGDVPQKIWQYASEKLMKVYCLNDENTPSLFGVGIETFLYLIKNAKCVVTDSFHATVFSLIFNTNFYVFKRTQEGVSDMFTRLQALLDLFCLTERVYCEDEFRYIENISKEKWDLVNKIMENERSKEMKYLSELLGKEVRG